MKRTRQKGAKPSMVDQAVPDSWAVDAVLALTPRCCRWPIGDPHAPGFAFCCDRADPGQPYCPAHTKASLPAT